MTTSAATSTPFEQSEEGRAFIQHRVGKAGLFGAAIGVAFLAFRTVFIATEAAWGDFAHPSFVFHVGGTASMLAMWVACRAGSRSLQVIRSIEALGLLGACVFYSAMVAYIPVAQSPHYIAILALQGGLTARAIYVPSTARRTFLLTAASGIPILVVTYLLYHDVDFAPYVALSGGDATKPLDSSVIARNITMGAALWWMAAIAICTGASNVIYGLRREVRNVRKLGQYELIEKLGEGGMGAVYKAHHAMLRRPTAIKLLPLEKAGERNITRFEKEVQQTARLTHPNTVTIFDYGRTPEGVFYYAMELLDGATLRDIVELDGPMPPARVVHLLRQIAGALAEAHGVGLIHRDIKPANIMLVQQGGEYDVAKVLDFGLVKELNREVSASLTQADAITGTPQYLSPEAISEPSTVDARSDLYALGAVAYYMVTGEHVFSGNTVVEVCSHHLHTAPEPPSQRLGGEVPADLERFIMKCLEKRPDDRPPSAAEAIAELSACDVGQWTDEDAQRWWDDRGQVLVERHILKADVAIGHTLDVDIARRFGITDTESWRPTGG